MMPQYGTVECRVAQFAGLSGCYRQVTALAAAE
jgi:hypothetical protein